MFYDRKTVVKGLTNITNMVKTGEYAWFANKLSTQFFISDEFGRNGVCNFYMTAPVITINYAMIFPVSYKLELQTQIYRVIHQVMGDILLT